jgi:hypothetical protein
VSDWTRDEQFADIGWVDFVRGDARLEADRSRPETLDVRVVDAWETRTDLGSTSDVTRALPAEMVAEALRHLGWTVTPPEK